MSTPPLILNKFSNTLYLDDTLGFFGDIMFQQACLINYQIIHQNKISYQSDKCCVANEYTLLKVTKKNVKAIFDQQVSILNQNF